MRIYSWNVNSVRARLERLTAWLGDRCPDVVCLQELKCSDEEYPRQLLHDAGYESVWFGQKTYNGVAILAKGHVTDVVRGLGDEDDGQARVISGTVAGVRVVSVYAPNGQALDSPAYRYKLDWYRRLETYLAHVLTEHPLVVVSGDFNVAPGDLDVHDVELWRGQTLFSEPERAALSRLSGLGLVDTFRALYPEAADRFSWWDYRMLAFPKNRGLRIDHVWASAALRPRLLDAGIDRDARKGQKPSDHAPVWAEFS